MQHQGDFGQPNPSEYDNLDDIEADEEYYDQDSHELPDHSYCVPLLAILAQQHHKVRSDESSINTPARQTL